MNLPEEIYLLRWKVHNTMGNAVGKGLITKSAVRAETRRKRREADPNCYDVELHVTRTAWRFMD